MKIQQPKRLFVEDDEILKEGEFRTNLRTCILTHGFTTLKKEDKFFDTVIVDALNKTKEVWEAIKSHDEIYASTALIPLFGGSYGSGMLFNNMMHKAIEEKLQGKKVYMLREKKSIRWDELKSTLLQGAFEHNELYVLSSEDDDRKWEKVDIAQLVGEIFFR